MDMVLAGASFPCGVANLGEVANQHGFNPVFIDHLHNASSIDAGVSPIRLEANIPIDIVDHDGRLLPLLESWVTEGCRLSEGAGLQFDKRAASISHSKFGLSKILAEEGIEHVARFVVETIEQCYDRAGILGYPVVLRADSGYSGRGVWIANSEDELRSLWSLQVAERASSDFAEMRSFLGFNNDVLIVEPWLGDEEWSVDCIVGPAGANVIRVCEKVSICIAGRPVTLGYRLIDQDDLFVEMRESVDRWLRALFTKDALSFACFDVRRNANDLLVPLDFGARLGSDGIPMLIRRVGGTRNPYAAALDAALASDWSLLASLEGGNAIVHAFARQVGTFAGMRVEGAGEVINCKNAGFNITADEGWPVLRKVGSVLKHYSSYKEFCVDCRNSSEWIRIDYL